MSILTAARLNALKTRPLLETNWHYLSASVLTTLNKTNDVPVLYKYALEHAPSSEHAHLTAQFRESLLKSAALIGLPRVINGLTALKDATPPEFRASTLLRDADRTDFRTDGRDLFALIYNKITNRVHGNLKLAYPDLDWFIQNFEYGPLLACTKVLGAKETSLVVISALISQDVNPQLKGHLKGAVNTGSTPEEVNAVRALAMEIAGWYGHQFPNLVSKL